MSKTHKNSFEIEKEHPEKGQVDILQHIQIPSLYKVILLNDDFTPTDFVIFILQEIFNHEPEQAFEIMKIVHEKGLGIAGVYTREVAETKVAQVRKMAKDQKYPLRCKMEKN